MVHEIERAEPPYVQIAAYIKQQIKSGELRPGDSVPPARKIAEQWRVSLATATKVLAALRAEGLAAGRPGIGTVVNPGAAQSGAQQDHTLAARHSVSVAAVVTDDQDRVLVIKRRDDGAWQLPGGVLELDETIEDGLRREVEEETGVKVEPVRLTGVYKNMKRGVVALVFLARQVGGAAHPTDESATVDWWPSDRVAAEMTEAFAVRILDALRDHPAPSIRTHDGIRVLR